MTNRFYISKLSFDSPTNTFYMDPIAQAVFIPEIVGMICDMCDQGDASRAARICRAWSEIALDRVWQDLPDIIYLLQLLHPLVETEEGLVWVFYKFLSVCLTQHPLFRILQVILSQAIGRQLFATRGVL